MEQSTFRFFTGTLAGLTIALAASGAAASPTFPDQIKTTLKLDYTPPCFICHQPGKSEGSNTMNQKFGLTMHNTYKVQPGQTINLGKALLADEKAGTDSDGDGTADIDELKGNNKSGVPTNPSSPDDTPINSVQPAYGCFATATGAGGGGSGASISGRSTVPFVGAALTAIALAFAMRRRR